MLNIGTYAYIFCLIYVLSLNIFMFICYASVKGSFYEAYL